MLRDHQLLAVRRDGVAGVPEIFFDEDGNVIRFLPGLITVMRDAKYTDEEILEWIFTDDDSLPGKPVEALHGPLAREVLRRASAEPFRTSPADPPRPPPAPPPPPRGAPPPPPPPRA